MSIYCEVALPVPLRSLFTYAIPDRLAGSICVGSRVLVPFRNRAMTGIVVEVSTRRPDPERVKKVREIAEALDPIPSLPPKLMELGRWVSGYYVAPAGEVFRAMLPPQIDLRHEREFVLTDSGRARRSELDAGGNRSEDEVAELALLSYMKIEDRPSPRRPLAQVAGRRGCRGATLAQAASRIARGRGAPAGARTEDCRVERKQARSAIH